MSSPPTPSAYQNAIQLLQDSGQRQMDELAKRDTIIERLQGELSDAQLEQLKLQTTIGALASTVHDLRTQQSARSSSRFPEELPNSRITSLGKLQENESTRRTCESDLHQDMREFEENDLDRNAVEETEKPWKLGGFIRHIAATLSVPTKKTDAYLTTADDVLQRVVLLKSELDACKELSADRGDLIQVLEQIVSAQRRADPWVEQIIPAIPRRVLKFAKLVIEQESREDQRFLVQRYAELHGLATSGKRRLSTTDRPESARRPRVEHMAGSEAMVSRLGPRLEGLEDEEAESREMFREESDSERTVGNGGSIASEKQLDELGLGPLPNVLEVLSRKY
jgi:hypothetical protein